ncbi:hypothetical protein [Vitiosangium sp. GDMCC 1.1324]|uniref:hypothetical protein n=1 Tax=Vitiosangium sp. (strain GDMCC 1.1324) TaxID=2138576 RepID=UPI000D37A589|nr:hypothetical protein [Vitiosangium sp. GDMCC 1.1324]PTL84204.1 hypothetical protein DAT35_12290 [Vitiosangium sp. GDMCC 1.1324]
MKTRVKVLGAVALAAVLGGVGCAGPKEATKDVEAAVPGLAQKREGLVTNVDRKDNRIEVNDVDHPGAPDAWFALSPKTKLERDGQMVTWDDIHEGTPVRVSFEPEVGAEKTYKVEILTGVKADEVKVKAEHLGK